MIDIDYDAISHNARVFKDLLGSSKLCAVVKNDAYGHNIESVVSAIDDIVDYYAVGSVAEADRVSSAKPILILLPIQANQLKHALSQNYHLTIDSFDSLNNLLSVIDSNSVANIHIKIDSGMHRLGFSKDDIPKLLGLLVGKNIFVEGVFSHFARADFDKSFTEMQFNYFLDCCNQIESHLQCSVIKHIANTSAVILDGKYHLDMARVGLGLYGYGLSGLKHAKSFCAEVIAIHKVCKNENVGYGNNVIQSDKRIAVLNKGYADGFVRELSDKYIFYINEEPCKVVGIICMGMTMVESNTAKVGDKAWLIGKDIEIDNSIAYELLTNLR